MTNSDSSEISRLLAQWNDGNQLALDELMPLVYNELRRMASTHLNRQYGHTFQTTELINEAYLKLAVKKDHDWKDRAHFFGVAAQAMRHILVDHARAKTRKKRGGKEALNITLDENALISTNRTEELVALDDALIALGTLDERKMRVVELKFFGGLKIKEMASVLKVSDDTVKNDWKFSKAWLLRELSRN